MHKNWPGGRSANIDALRGIAALSVLFFHASKGTAWGPTGKTPDSHFGVLLWVLSFGFAGVYLFFVISGFCIHLRWARGRAAGGPVPELDFLDFWRRRARRLYPPYLIVLALFLVALALEGEWRATGFNLYDVGLHVLMIHNLDDRTIYSISGVFWTLAIEEQLYLMYFGLLKLRLRLGWARTLLCCLAVRGVWFVLCLVLYRALGVVIPVSGSPAAHWFAWALGALSVEAAVGIVALPAWSRDARLAALVLMAAVAIESAGRFAGTTGLHHKLTLLVASPTWAVGFFVAVNGLVASEAAWRSRRATPALVSRLAAVGIFSYSLYLTHELILNHLAPPIARCIGGADGPALALALSPFCLGFAWLFFRAFEAPFIPRPSAARTAPIPRVLDEAATLA